MRLRIVVVGLTLGFSLACGGGSLKGVPVQSITVTSDKPQGICAGEDVEVEIAANTATEKLKVGVLGDASWDDFLLKPSLGTLSYGMWSAPDHPMELWSHDKLTLGVLPIHHPKLATTLDVPIRWDCQPVASWTGEDGLDGWSGGSALFGKDGERGQDGDPGADLHVLVEARLERSPLGRDLAVIRVTQGQTMKIYAYDPAAGGSFTLRAVGGDGGDGGNGGDGEDRRRRGPSGEGGNGGDGGNGGNGGRAFVDVDFDPSLEAYRHTLVFDVRPGNGGKPGRAGNGGDGSGLFSEDGTGGISGQWGQTPPEEPIRWIHNSSSN